MKTLKQISLTQYYYGKLFSHNGIGESDEHAIRFFKKNFLCLSSLLLLTILFYIFRNSKFVHYITYGNKLVFVFYCVLFFYTFLVGISYTLYQLISLWYEKKYSKKLEIQKMTVCCKLLIYLYKTIHYPWILLACSVQKILKKLKIQDLEKYLPILVFGYMFFLLSLLSMLQVLCTIIDVILNKYKFLINTYFTETTYLYLIVFISIVITKHIPALFLKWALFPYIDKKSLKFKKILSQYNLLNDYFLVVVTLILKVLNYEVVTKNLVDALFYTTNAFALFSAIEQKRKEVN